MEKKREIDHFRIFIDAATLKPIPFVLVQRTNGIFPHLYRCGHIEAEGRNSLHTRHGLRFPHLYRCGHIEAFVALKLDALSTQFPHLYRCGHIEAFVPLDQNRRLKRFPHLYRCGHIEAEQLPRCADAHPQPISASL